MYAVHGAEIMFVVCSAVVFNPGPGDPLLCTCFMSPVFITPDSDH